MYFPSNRSREKKTNIKQHCDCVISGHIEIVNVKRLLLFLLLFTRVYYYFLFSYFISAIITTRYRLYRFAVKTVLEERRSSAGLRSRGRGGARPYRKTIIIIIFIITILITNIETFDNDVYTAMVLREGMGMDGGLRLNDDGFSYGEDKNKKKIENP